MNPQSLVGKPLVVYIDGARHEIGTIERATIKDGSLYIGASINIKEAPSK